MRRSNLVFNVFLGGVSRRVLSPPQIATEAISSLMSFGWSVEEGTLTSSICKGGIAFIRRGGQTPFELSPKIKRKAKGEIATASSKPRNDKKARLAVTFFFSVILSDSEESLPLVIRFFM